jgi:hypothetical protein
MKTFVFNVSSVSLTGTCSLLEVRNDVIKGDHDSFVCLFVCGLFRDSVNS